MQPSCILGREYGEGDVDEKREEEAQEETVATASF
jgi:hypothetical protein